MGIGLGSGGVRETPVDIPGVYAVRGILPGYRQRNYLTPFHLNQSCWPHDRPLKVTLHMELDSILKIRAVEAETGEDIVGATCDITDLISGKRLTATTVAALVTPEQEVQQETAFKRFA